MPTTPPEIEGILHEVQRQAQIRNWNAPNLEYVFREALTTLHQKHQEEVEKIVEAIQNDIYNLSRKHSPLEDNCPPDCELCLGYNTALMDVRNMPSLTPTKSDKQTKI